MGGVQQVTGHMSALMRRGEEGEGRRGGFNVLTRMSGRSLRGSPHMRRGWEGSNKSQVT